MTATVSTHVRPSAIDFPILRLPGVYRPQADTALLAAAAAAAPLPRGARVLDAFTGTGALAVAAARLGAAEVTAVDISRRAVLCARLNAWRLALPVSPRRGALAEVAGSVRYDVVLANPPYVPCPSPQVPTGRKRAWDAGPDGRLALDPLCRAAPEMLNDKGFLLLVHSLVSGVDRSLALLRAGGLSVRVVARRRVPFGPVMWARASYLESAGLIERGQRHEDLVVIRADRR